MLMNASTMNQIICNYLQNQKNLFPLGIYTNKHSLLDKYL